jgi:hypothetical protein
MRLENVRVEEIGGEPGDVYVREIASRFHVHYEVYPESLVLSDHKIRQIGFCLELYGEVGAALGKNRVQEVRRSLRVIASSVLQADAACSFEVIEPADTLCYCSSQRGFQFCVRLAIRILHRTGWEHPLDGLQRRALAEMEQRLGHLGVTKGAA